MDNVIKEIKENISGIWANDSYELVIGLNDVFTFEEKESEKVTDGFYSIFVDSNDHYIKLRLTELNGTNNDYIIHELTAFGTLEISREGVKINFTNVPPDEYQGEVFNPANN